MNYYFTYSDKNYIHIAERLFKSLQVHSSYKIIYYTINFDYDNKFDNVIPIRYDFDHTKFLPYELNEEQMQHWTKKYMLYLKCNLCLDILNKKENNNYCCIDSDMMLIKNADFLFNKINDNVNHPILPLNCYEYMLMDGHGNPYDENNNLNVNKCLEADLMKFLSISIEKRDPFYKQCNLLLFNKNSLKLFEEWYEICYRPEIIKNKYLAGMNEESVLNCLLWKYDYNANFDHIHINIPSDEVNTLVSAFNNPSDNSFFLKDFCRIPEKQKIQNIIFLHGRPNPANYKILETEIIYKNKQNNSINFSHSNRKIYYKINCSNLGDTLSSTPVVRKLSKLYKTKLNIINDAPEIFKNNPYVDKIISCKDFDVKNISGDYEFFESFVLAGQKNQFGVERKFSTFDIRQIHAMDLGFSLMPEEMLCDFFPTEYDNPFNLPDNYVVLHTAKNWPNRTWSKENWQQVINYLAKRKIYTVLIGKNAEEKDYHHIKKDFYEFENLYGQNLINKDNLNLCWHILNKSKIFITFDTGPLHLAGTTEAFILQLGSAKDPRLTIPYRYGTQDYKYKILKGPCDIYCTNNLKYSIKEWNTINAIPPLIGCLDNKASFECQPSVNQVIEYLDAFL